MSMLRELVVAAATVMALAGQGGVWAASAEAAVRPYIEVAAEAEAKAAPDLAYVDFGVVARADTASAAAQQNGTRMKAVLSAVRGALGQDAQIGTGTYNVRAEYSTNRDGGEPRVVGYVASNVVRLETRELLRLGEVIDVAVKAGSNQVQRIAFGLSDAGTPRRRALRDAVLKAQAEAETIAAALKVTLGPVASVTDHDTGPIRPLGQDAVMMRAQAAASTPIEPGVIYVRARVVLRVEIAR